jgi:hypothetical protein
MHLILLEPVQQNMDVVILTITCQRHQPLQLRLIKQVNVHHVQVVPAFQMITLYVPVPVDITKMVIHALRAPFAGRANTKQE